MKFILIDSGSIPEVNVRYATRDYAFDSTLLHPDLFEPITSVALRELQLEIEPDGHALFLWGFAPYTAWKVTDWAPSEYRRKALYVTLDEPPIPGVSIALSDAETWPQYVNRDAGWFCMGNPEKIDDLVEFATGFLAAVDNGRLLAVWIQFDADGVPLGKDVL